MERAGDTLYDYLDGKKRLDIPKASERPGTAKAGLPRAKDTVVRPEKRPKHKKSQKTIYKQPKQVTYTDLQTAIPVKSGKGNTYPAAIREEREARRKRDERLTYLIVFCVVIFIAAAVWLVRIFIGYRMTAGEYADIRETYVVMPAAWTGNEEQEKDNDAFYPSLQINFASLYALNEDFIGWLYLPGCGISYPLVQGEDNDYYLNHTFLNTEAAGGAIFVDYTDKADFSSLNTFVYGHNMQDGSMFGSLYRYGQDASLIGSYPYFYVYLSGGSVRKYRIFSYYQDREDSQTYVRIEDESAYGEYLQMLVDKSVRLPDGSQVSDTPPTTEDTIVTLSTCHGRADSGQRFLVHGVLVGVY